MSPANREETEALLGSWFGQMVAGIAADRKLTVDAVFQRHLLPRSELMHRGRLVDPAAIRDVALLAIEGERDDISGVGQTRAGLGIATRLPEKLKRYHLAEGVGHYGIFHGSKWRNRIAPVLEAWIAKHD